MSTSKITRPAHACLCGLGLLVLSACAQKAEQKTEAPPAPAPVHAPVPPPKLQPAGEGVNKEAKNAGAFNPLGGWIGAGPPPGSTAEQTLLHAFKGALVGTWVADLGNGVTEERSYTAAGTFTAKLTGPAPASATGKYTVLGLVGTKGLRIQLDAGGPPRTVTVTFDDNELLHPTLQPGVTGTFRKK